MLCGIFGGITQRTLVEKASKGEGRKRQESESAMAATTPELAVTAEKPPLEPSGLQATETRDDIKSDSRVLLQSSQLAPRDLKSIMCRDLLCEMLRTLPRTTSDEEKRLAL